MKDFFKKFNKDKVFLSASLFVLFCLFNLSISDCNCRKDMSRFNRFDLTESTSKIIKGLPEKLYINAFYSTDVPGEYRPRLELAKEMIRQIASIDNSKVELRLIDPGASESDKRKANEYGIEPQTLQKVERGAAEVKQAYFGMALTLGAKTEVIPVAFFAEQIEYQMLSTLKKMVRKNPSSGVAILKAPGAHSAPQPGPGSGKDTFGIFIHQAFAPEYGNVPEVDVNAEPISEEFTTLIWVGTAQLTELGRYHLDQFLMRGGNLLLFSKTMDFSLEGGRRQMGMGGMSGEGMARAVPEAVKIKEFTTHYGFEVKTDMVLEPELGMPMGPLVQLEQGMIGRYHYPLWLIAAKKEGGIAKDNIFTKNTEALILPWSSGIEIFQDKQKSVKFTKLIESSKKAGRKEDFLMIGEKEVASAKIDSTGNSIPLGIHIEGTFTSFFKPETLPDKKLKDSFLSQTREGKKSQIVVFGTPYLITDILALRDFRETYQETNIPFVMNLLDVLSGDTDLLAARGRKAGIMNLKPFSKTIQVFFSFLNVLIIPAFITIYAFFRIKKRNQGAGVK